MGEGEKAAGGRGVEETLESDLTLIWVTVVFKMFAGYWKINFTQQGCANRHFYVVKSFRNRNPTAAGPYRGSGTGQTLGFVDVCSAVCSMCAVPTE